MRYDAAEQILLAKPFASIDCLNAADWLVILCPFFIVGLVMLHLFGYYRGSGSEDSGSTNSECAEPGLLLLNAVWIKIIIEMFCIIQNNKCNNLYFSQIGIVSISAALTLSLIWLIVSMLVTPVCLKSGLLKIGNFGKFCHFLKHAIS